jgi:hypothetical protein
LRCPEAGRAATFTPDTIRYITAIQTEWCCCLQVILLSKATYRSNKLILWMQVLVEKPTATEQALKTLPAFYGRGFITTFAKSLPLVRIRIHRNPV